MRRGVLAAAVIVATVATAAAQRPDPDLAEVNRSIEGGRFEAALAGVEAALGRRPSDPQALFLKGVALAASLAASGGTLIHAAEPVSAQAGGGERGPLLAPPLASGCPIFRTGLPRSAQTMLRCPFGHHTLRSYP